MMKKMALITIILLLATLTALAQPAADSLRAVDARIWPTKADWLGQKISIVPAKLNASASYLLVFSQPGQVVTGVDQLFFARTLIGKTYTIRGLYELPKKGAVSEYYWRLDSPTGQAAAWVKDTRDASLANMPFVLEQEIAEENKLAAELQALSGKTVWIDRNRVLKNELSADIRHLTPLTVTGFKSAGPFSETYLMTFTQASGEPLVWQLKPTGERAAYSHSQFLWRFQRDFFAQDPQSLHPEWSSADWDLIKGREIRTGWNSEMVTMSWGDPDRREIIELGPYKGLTMWRYPEGYHLYFKDKTLLKIRVPRPADKQGNNQATQTPQPPPVPQPAKPTVKDGKDTKTGKDQDDGLIEVPSATKEKKPAKTPNEKEAD